MVSLDDISDPETRGSFSVELPDESTPCSRLKLDMMWQSALGQESALQSRDIMVIRPSGHRHARTHARACSQVRRSDVTMISGRSVNHNSKLS